jgi:hypothetical protein
VKWLKNFKHHLLIFAAASLYGIRFYTQKTARFFWGGGGRGGGWGKEGALFKYVLCIKLPKEYFESGSRDSNWIQICNTNPEPVLDPEWQK